MSHMTEDGQNCNLRRKLLEFQMKESKAAIFAFPGVSDVGEQNLVALPVVGQISSEALTTLC